MLSRLLITYVDSVLGLLRRVDMGNITDVSELFSTFIIRNFLTYTLRPSMHHISPKRRNHRTHPHGVKTPKQNQDHLSAHQQLHYLWN